MTQYKAIPIEDYYVIVSDESPSIGELGINTGNHNTVTRCKSEVPDIAKNHVKKVIFQSKEVHEGVPLIELPWEEDVEAMARVFHDQHKYASSHIADIVSFKYGYSKAKEKYRFTEKDAWEIWRRGYDKAVSLINEDRFGYEDKAPVFDQVIQSLKKPKSFEVEIQDNKIINYKEI